MRRLVGYAFSAALATSAPAQEAPPPAGAPAATPMPGEDLVGWYEVTLNIPPTQCRLNKNAGGEWRAVVEVTRGRRGLVLHLEQLKSWFTQPVVIVVQPNGSFGYSGKTPVDLGIAITPVGFNLNGGVNPDRQSFDARFRAEHPFCTFEGRMTGKRTTAPAAPAPSDQSFTGASVFTDSAVPYTPPPEQPVPSGPSPLINGRYLTTLTVNESRCVGGDHRGKWRGTLNLEAGRPAIMIPLQDYGPLFDGPLILNVEGLVLKQTSAEIPIKVGMVGGSVPATFNGNFDADGSRFQVRFEAGNALCRLGGSIEGDRS